jgi:hypothetical protein
MTTFRQATRTTTPENFLYWKGRAKKSGLYDALVGFETNSMYNVHPALIKEVFEKDNPLKNLQSRDDLLSKLSSPWPMVLFFDILTEKNGVPPSWNQYFNSMMTTYRDKWVDYASSNDISHRRLVRAARWRMGNAYIAWMRELLILTELRQKGYNVHRHTFADVEGKVDLFTLSPSLKGVSITVKSNWDIKKKKPTIPFLKVFLPSSGDLNIPKHTMEEIENWLST